MHPSKLLCLVLVASSGCRYVTGLDDLDPANYSANGGQGAAGGSAPGSGGASSGGGGIGGTGATSSGGGGTGGSGGGGGSDPCEANALFPTDFGGCARLRSGDVHCWGYDIRNWGNCSESFRRVPAPELVPQFADAVELRQYDVSCWLDDAGVVRCTGENDECEANGLPGDACQPVVPALPAAATSLSTNIAASCAIVEKDLYCWGDGTMIYGFPFGASACDAPTKHTALGGGVIDFAMGYDFRCYVLDETSITHPGRVLCEGENEEKQLGLATNVDQVGLVEVLLPEKDFVSVKTGDVYGLALTNDGEVHCWGGDTSFTYQRQCGGTTANAAPALVDLPGAAVEISAGREHACAVLADRSLVCWGADITEENAGIPRAVHAIELNGAPFKVPAGEPNNRVSAGYWHTCALNEDGRVYCWGYNTYYYEDPDPPIFGVLGTGSQESYVTAPEPVLITCTEP